MIIPALEHEKVTCSHWGAFPAPERVLEAHPEDVANLRPGMIVRMKRVAAPETLLDFE